ncbi:hypothetical protein TNIN_256981 [Trichonephila inaurata madagascariensis]|uniref:Uncharacterized protein n=1 Tax=Trichonephila inaurata madagascariensis TaxID=2747483 RepID=A0A8X7BR57_9ARAC|nr:hypothetical protein TNIN_256981 [Trichonephila inaurata madagascariensis]
MNITPSPLNECFPKCRVRASFLPRDGEEREREKKGCTRFTSLPNSILRELKILLSLTFRGEFDRSRIPQNILRGRSGEEWLIPLLPWFVQECAKDWGVGGGGWSSLISAKNHIFGIVRDRFSLPCYCLAAGFNPRGA